MGYSTWNINNPGNIIAELISTSDPKMADYLGEKIRVLTVGREYKNEIVQWKKSDDGRLFAEYNKMFCEFEL